MSLGQDCRDHGGHVVLTSDHNWQGSIRQRILDPIRYRLLFKKKFDAIFVAGESGRVFYQKMGVPNTQIYSGLYSADPEIFKPGPSLSQRPKNLLFVGQLIERKNILQLCEAFISMHAENPEWSLHIYGAGELADSVPTHPAIVQSHFAKPVQLSRVMRSSRCLVLPSHEENWGVVVHEAALSGCALALSNQVGAAADFAVNKNSVKFCSRSKSDMVKALQEVMSWSEKQWDEAGCVSLERALRFSPLNFANTVEQLAHDIVNSSGLRGVTTELSAMQTDEML